MSDNRNRRNRTLELGVILLISEILKLGFDSIPPVTLITVIGQILLYVGFLDVPWDKYDVCISGYKVWHKQDWRSLLVSTFEHGDDMHLYYNMISFLVKGRTLERKHGTANFALLLLFLCVATPALYVALAVAGANALHEKDMMRSCAIGFSGVIFALKLITTVEESGYSYIAGFQVPVKYSSWVELIAIHMLVPNASFMGHLAGILAGVLYMKTPIGSLVDVLIHSITGRRMNHNRSFSHSSSSSYNSGEGSSYQYGFRDNFNSYGSSSSGRGAFRNPYGTGYFSGYGDYDVPQDYSSYDSRPSAPPGWRF